MATTPDALFGSLFSGPFHSSLHWKPRKARRDELSLAQGVRIGPLPSGLSEEGSMRMLEDFREFFAAQSIELEASGAGTTLRFIVLRGKARGRHRIEVTGEGITVSADTAEGIRRALVWLEDEMQARQGPFLPLGIVEQQEIIRTRISRCFYGPIQRPPLNRNELADDINYYPETYLNRLAHDGVTALWITVKFRESVPSQLFPEFGKHAKTHLEKLRATVKRCAHYGIKIYVFCIEPAAIPVDSPILVQHPELRGAQEESLVAFCTRSELAHTYLAEAAETLFREVPGLGGMIVIPVGERYTHCASLYPHTLERCPSCAKLGRNQVLHGVLESFRRGMDRVAPEAELISWPYGQMILWGKEAMVDAAGHVPPGVILQHNYETGGIAQQLGKPRPLWDYWLSWTGVSDVFAASAKKVHQNKGRIMAKLQVGTSHEDATVPFLPVPGLLYRKYQAMHRMGISGAMQSWYFGNNPSLMTRAAGLLSYAPLPATEKAFLFQLARKEWGPQAKTIARAWECFGRAYENFPATHLFSYYGPVQNGVTWPLYLKPRRFPLSPSWKIDFPPSGDYLSHCFSHRFTLRELITLCERIVGDWQRGCALLESAYIASEKSKTQRHERNIAEAIRLQFETALAILCFYELREQLAEATAKADRLKLLGEMRDIVKKEIPRRRAFLPLLKKEPTLGYHSEAEGFKITTALVESSISHLQELLKTEFPELREEAGATVDKWFGEYTGRSPEVWPKVVVGARTKQQLRYWLFEESAKSVTRESTKAHSKGRLLPVKAAYRLARTDATTLQATVELECNPKDLEGWEPLVLVDIEPQRMQPYIKYELDSSGNGKVFYEDSYLDPDVVFTAPWHYTAVGKSVSIPISAAQLHLPDFSRPFRMNLRVLFCNSATGESRELSWVQRKPMKERLAWGDVNPATDYGWVFLE